MGRKAGDAQTSDTYPEISPQVGLRRWRVSDRPTLIRAIIAPEWCEGFEGWCYHNNVDYEVLALDAEDGMHVGISVKDFITWLRWSNLIV